MRKRDVLFAAVAVTVVAGAIRQGRDAAAVRRGARAGVYADTVSTQTIPTLFAVPARPNTAVGQFAALVWSAPVTVVGIVLALAGGSRPTFDRTRGCLVARDVKGVNALLQRRVNADAHTMGQVVLCGTKNPSAALLDHESGHVRQAERFGVLMPIVYALLTAIHGYAANPFEVAARNFAASDPYSALQAHAKQDALDNAQSKEQHEDGEVKPDSTDL